MVIFSGLKTHDKDLLTFLIQKKDIHFRCLKCNFDMLMVFLSNRENGNVVGALEYNCTQFTWRFVIGLRLVNRNG